MSFRYVSLGFALTALFAAPPMAGAQDLGALPLDPLTSTVPVAPVAGAATNALASVPGGSALPPISLPSTGGLGGDADAVADITGTLPLDVPDPPSGEGSGLPSDPTTLLTDAGGLPELPLPSGGGGVDLPVDLETALDPGGLPALPGPDELPGLDTLPGGGGMELPDPVFELTNEETTDLAGESVHRRVRITSEPKLIAELTADSVPMPVSVELPPEPGERSVLPALPVPEGTGNLGVDVSLESLPSLDLPAPAFETVAP